MSKLNELIAELCPDGVEYRKLGTFTECFSGATPRKRKPEYWNDGTIPWMSSGEVHQHVVRHVEGRITQLGYDSCSTRMVPVGTVLVALAGQGKTRGTVAITEMELCTNQSIGAIICSSLVDSKYLYYYLSGQYDYLRRISSGEGTRGGLNMPLIRDLSIPVPPVEVQREIVRILDSFQGLDDALTAEIEARKKQLCAVQETLFDSLIGHAVPLGEHVRFINGRAYKKDELLSAGKYRVLRVGNFFSNDSWYFSDLELDADKYCHKGDLLYAWSASFGPRIWHGEKTIFHYHIWKLDFDKESLNRDYLLHFLDYDSRVIKSSTSVTNSTMMHVSMAQMKKRLFPMPNIETQEAVANSLNSITSLVNALRSERDARRKQFAYYRDKLLSFPEKVAVNG